MPLFAAFTVFKLTLYGFQLTSNNLFRVCAANEKCLMAEYYAFNTGNSTYPYDLTAGTWQEWNSSSNTLVNNENMAVTCYAGGQGNHQ